HDAKGVGAGGQARPSEYLRACHPGLFLTFFAFLFWPILAAAQVTPGEMKPGEPSFKGVGLSRWLELLDDADGTTRGEAEFAVKRICERFGPKAKDAVPALAKALINNS